MQTDTFLDEGVGLSVRPDWNIEGLDLGLGVVLVAKALVLRPVTQDSNDPDARDFDALLLLG